MIPTNRVYIDVGADLDAVAQVLPRMLEEMAPGDTLAFRRCDPDESPTGIEIIQTKGIAREA